MLSDDGRLGRNVLIGLTTALLVGWWSGYLFGHWVGHRAGESVEQELLWRIIDNAAITAYEATRDKDVCLDKLKELKAQ